MSISLSTSNLIDSNYKLALKFFMNKNFTKSFEILKVEYHHVVQNLKSGVIDESLFNKIINLYLTEVGLIFQSNNDFKVDKVEKTILSSQLKDDIILHELIGIYQDINDIPAGILYNLYLANYLSLELHDVHQKFIKLYPKLNFDGGDKYLKKWVELFVLKILPELHLLDDAKQIIHENPIIDNEIDYITRLNALEKMKHDEDDRQSRLKLQKIRDQKKKQNQDKLDKDLKYKSLKQIRNSNAVTTSPISNNSTPVNHSNGIDMATIKNKLMYHYKLTKNFITSNSPVVIIVLIMLIIITRILRVRRVNIGQNLKETLKMAFKISYL